MQLCIDCQIKTYQIQTVIRLNLRCRKRLTKYTIYFEHCLAIKVHSVIIQKESSKEFEEYLILVPYARNAAELFIITCTFEESSKGKLK